MTRLEPLLTTENTESAFVHSVKWCQRELTLYKHPAWNLFSHVLQVFDGKERSTVDTVE